MSDTVSWLREQPEPPDSVLTAWEAEPLVPTDEAEVSADVDEEWGRDDGCD